MRELMGRIWAAIRAHSDGIFLVFNVGSAAVWAGLLVVNWGLPFAAFCIFGFLFMVRESYRSIRNIFFSRE